MKRILVIIALFFCSTLVAQEHEPTYGREPARGELIVYPTAQEASAADGEDNKYFTRIAEWTQEGSVFKADFTMPFAWLNRQVLLHIGWATADYEVRINGNTVAYNSDCNTPAEFNITRYAKEDRNALEIVLSSPSKVAKLEGWKTAGTSAVGPAWVMSQPTLRIRDILTRTWRADTSNDFVTAEVGMAVKSEGLNPRTSRIHYELLSPEGKRVESGYKEITLGMRGEDTIRFLATIQDSMLWSPAHPNLYKLKARTQHNGRDEEFIEVPLGFRTVETSGGKLLLNGHSIKLHAKEVSPQLTANQIADLKKAGFNTLKLSAGPLSPEFYGTCDSLGLLVVAQAPIDTHKSGNSRQKGGNPSNDPQWQQAFIERTVDSYHSAKRHPSVVAFSLATQSANGINLYESYLKLKQLDESRPFIYQDAAKEWNSDALDLE